MNPPIKRLLATILIITFSFPSVLIADDPKPSSGQSAIFAKLQTKIPEIKLNNATIAETIEFLRLRSIELDPAKEKKGLNFVIYQSSKGTQISDTLIDGLDARNMSILEILNLVCLKTKTQYQLDEFAVVILPIPAEDGNPASREAALIQRKWTTPPNFLDYITPPAGKLARLDITTLLETLGVSFPPNAAAAYLRASDTLVVRNTPANHHLIDAIVKGSLDPEATLAERQAVDKIIIPEIHLNNTTLEEAVEFLRLRSLELDPAKKGVNINVLGDEKLPHRIIASLNLKDVPLTTALRYICTHARTRVHIQGATFPSSREDFRLESGDRFRNQPRFVPSSTRVLRGRGFCTCPRCRDPPEAGAEPNRRLVSIVA